MRMHTSLFLMLALACASATAQESQPTPQAAVEAPKRKLSLGQRFKNRMKNAIELTYAQQMVLRQQQQAQAQSQRQRRVLSTYDVTGTIVNEAGACTSSGCVYR